MNVEMNTGNVKNVRFEQEAANLDNASGIRKEVGAEVVKQEAADKIKEENLQKAVYGDTLSVSENGDTVNAKRAALAALKDGIVLNKTDSGRAAEETDEEIDDLTGYSADQLETLYQQGKIDKAKYDREIERRERLEGKDQAKDENIKETEQDKDEKVEDTTQKIEQMNEETARIAKMAGEEQQEMIRIDAMTRAIGAGRGDLMDQILNGNK